MTDADDIIRGRARIAHEVGRSVRTIDRWIARGILPVEKDGPFRNSIVEIRSADLERAKQGEVGE